MKALTVVILVLLLALVFDPITPLLYLVWTIAVTLLLGRVNLKKYGIYFIPFLLIAFGMFWTTLVFAEKPPHPNDIVQLFGMEIPRESLFTALSLALRVLSFAMLSLMFILTTDPTRFILSLMQQCKLSPKLAYGVLAGFRFLPMMKEELKNIRAAHRIRGVSRANGWKESLVQFKRYSIPLLAGAIRKAERTAIAMESKGFTCDRNRSFYRAFAVDKRDWIFLGVMIGMLILIALTSWNLGYFQWYNGEI